MFFVSVVRDLFLWRMVFVMIDFSFPRINMYPILLLNPNCIFGWKPMFFPAFILKQRFNFLFVFFLRGISFDNDERWFVTQWGFLFSVHVGSDLDSKRRVPNHFENFPDLNACMYVYIWHSIHLRVITCSYWCQLRLRQMRPILLVVDKCFGNNLVGCSVSEGGCIRRGGRFLR